MSSVKTRIKQKNDSTTNWNTANAEGFKPLQGEIIVYNDVNRIKIGDGSNTVSNVPFLDDNCVHLTDNETITGYKKFENPITIKDSISNSDIMLSATNAANNPGVAGEITWHDGEGNEGAVYIPQGQSETLAMCYKIQGKHFQPFAVGDDLSGQTLYFNDQAHFDQYFQAVYTILTSSGGYSIEVGGPPDITLKKNGTIVATFYTYSNSSWLESYTLPSDFGTVETLDSKGGAEAFSSSKPSIWYTLGLGPAEDYANIDVEDVYNHINTVRNKLNLDKAPNNHASISGTYGVGTLQNYGHVKLISGDLNGKTPQDGYAASQSHIHTQYALKANPSFTGNATIGGNLTVNGTATFQNEVRVNSSAGTLGQVLTSQGAGNSPQWKNIPTPSNMVTTGGAQTIDGYKTFRGGLLIEESSATFTGVGTPESPNYIIDCYENSGTNDSLFAVKVSGEDKGQVLFGDGTVDCSISFGERAYISSNVIFGASSTSYPRNTVSASGMTILSSSTAVTNYGATSISRQSGNNGYTISLPSGNGTLALTNQIPIKTATLSGTTLSITLG